ncbi:CoA transferase [Halobacteriovorax sp. GB3]|uniref:CoA transferase n=1 Tax=Halobacteriovorax sp. GB3 TaxID=2719615 RepID=UPI0030820421
MKDKKLNRKDFLEDIQIVEFTSRLPGPLAGHLFSDYGAKVTKIDLLREDPFNNSELSKRNPLFQSWYDVINEQKDLISLTNVEQLQEPQVRALLAQADVLIIALGPKQREKLYYLLDQNEHWKDKVILEIVASEDEKKYLHDLNVLAQQGLLKFLNLKKKENKHLPLLPFGGIVFSTQIVSDVMAALLKKQKHKGNLIVKSGLEQAVQRTLGPLKAPSNIDSLALHNGKFPCYNIYSLKCGKYVALGSIEPHFWQTFLETLSLPKELNAFDESGNVYKEIQTVFDSKTAAELGELLQNKGHFCLDIFEA